MSERIEPCKQCGNYDWYYRGTFSYCRPCHNEASRKYNRKLSDVEPVILPKRDLQYLISPRGRRGSAERNKVSCPKGHPYNSENTYWSTQKSGRAVNRRCRVCDRNNKRLKYGLPVEPAYQKLTDLLDT